MCQCCASQECCGSDEPLCDVSIADISSLLLIIIFQVQYIMPLNAGSSLVVWTGAVSVPVNQTVIGVLYTSVAVHSVWGRLTSSKH